MQSSLLLSFSSGQFAMEKRNTLIFFLDKIFYNNSQ